MPINFHNVENRFSYSNRQVDPEWIKNILAIANPQGKQVLDIGCGGGLYTRVWAQLGASNVLGIDFSEVMIQTARDLSANIPNISFSVGDATLTGLDDKLADIIFERALIHHVSDISSCLNEAFRLLKTGGIYIVQDRTPDDIVPPASEEHIRGYFFEKFPHLLEFEHKRRPHLNKVKEELIKSGFSDIRTFSFWETRKIYPSMADLTTDLRERKGRSILHEINDIQLENLITYISSSIRSKETIIEKDRWTIWTALKSP